MSVSRGTFYPTQVIRTRGFAEIENLDRELAEQTPAPPPQAPTPVEPEVTITDTPAVIPVLITEVTPDPTPAGNMETEIITIQLPRDEIITEDVIIEMIEDHLEIPQANRSMDEETPEWMKVADGGNSQEKTWAEQISEEDEPAQAMRRLSVEDRSTSPSCEGYP